MKKTIVTAFTPEEISTVKGHLNSIIAVLKPKSVNLTPDQRREMGSIDEKNKLVVNKSKTYMEEQPEHIPNVIIKTRFDTVYDNRIAMETLLMIAGEIIEMLSDTKIYYDKDNYDDTTAYYGYIQYLKDRDVPGITTIYNDLKQFFAKSKHKEENNEIDN